MNKRLLILLLFAVFPAFAQQSPRQSDSSSGSSNEATSTQPDNGNAKEFLRTLLGDEYRMWTSPFRIGDYDRHTMVKYGLPFLAASAALIATDHRTTGAIPPTGSQTFVWSGRVAQVGAPYTLAAATGALFLISKATHENHLSETGLLSLEALGHSQLIALGIKEITQRERPADPVQNDSFWEGGSSFPSGHATGAFAVATVFAYEYGGQHIAVPIVGFSLASVVAASRVSGRKHWLSDVFVGSGLGFMEGRYIYKRHHDPNLPGSEVRRVSRLIPAFDVGTSGGTLYWEF
jgi:membrane-associated phospholipid phosphatase